MPELSTLPWSSTSAATPVPSHLLRVRVRTRVRTRVRARVSARARVGVKARVRVRIRVRSVPSHQTSLKAGCAPG